MGLFRHKRAMQNESSNADGWLLTYADAVTLILTFFIVIVAISEPIEEEMLKIQEALKAAGFVENSDTEGGGVEGKDKEMLQKDLQEMIEQEQAYTDLAVELFDNGVLLEMSSASFFKAGSVAFTDAAIPLLTQAGYVLRDYMEVPLEIQVEGHTDDTPMESKDYPSNWELSAARAAAVVRFLIQESELTPSKMKASGLAETRPKVPNRMADGAAIIENQELNRRIEIKIEYLD